MFKTPEFILFAVAILLSIVAAGLLTGEAQALLGGLAIGLTLGAWLYRPVFKFITNRDSSV